MSMLPRFVVLYALMYAAFGVSSPFLPAFFSSRGLSPEQIGLLFALGTGIRLVSGPLCGRLADLTRALRTVLAVCAALAALVALGLLSASGFAALLAISAGHAAALAPTTTLADALALRAARPPGGPPRFEYGWVRGTGSAVFIVGTLIGGQAVGAWGLPSILVLQALLLGATAATVGLVPAPVHAAGVRADTDDRPAGVRRLLMLPRFRRVMLVSALVLGSHAMHDTFAVIRWTAAGITPATVSVLWSESVAAEVLVFFLIGPTLLQRASPAGVAALAATAGVLRWTVVAWTADATALALVQPLHGLTFAALHLACMRLIATIVPPPLAATGQALYALGAAATTAVLIQVAGWLYASLAGWGFLGMALLCAVAVPLTPGLRSPPTRSG